MIEEKALARPHSLITYWDNAKGWLIIRCPILKDLSEAISVAFKNLSSLVFSTPPCANPMINGNAIVPASLAIECVNPSTSNSSLENLRLDQLPPEILVRILSLLPFTDILRMRKISRLMKQIASSPSCLTKDHSKEEIVKEFLNVYPLSMDFEGRMARGVRWDLTKTIAKEVLFKFAKHLALLALSIGARKFRNSLPPVTQDEVDAINARHFQDYNECMENGGTECIGDMEVPCRLIVETIAGIENGRTFLSWVPTGIQALTGLWDIGSSILLLKDLFSDAELKKRTRRVYKQILDDLAYPQDLTSHLPQLLDYTCKITERVPVFPVRDQCGHLFDYFKIEDYLKDRGFCPIRSHRLLVTDLIFDVKAFIFIQRTLTEFKNSSDSLAKKIRTFKHFPIQVFERLIKNNQPPSSSIPSSSKPQAIPEKEIAKLVRRKAKEDKELEDLPCRNKNAHEHFSFLVKAFQAELEILQNASSLVEFQRLFCELQKQFKMLKGLSKSIFQEVLSELQLDEATLQLLMDRQQLAPEDFLNRLQSTMWNACLTSPQFAMNFPFAIRKNPRIVLNERQWQQYTATITVTEEFLPDLIQLMTRESSCVPAAIVVDCQQELSPETARLLLFCTNIKQIQLKSVLKICFQTLDLSHAEERSFLNLLPNLHCPDLEVIGPPKHLQLYDHPEQFFHYITFQPVLGLYGATYTLWPQLLNIQLPLKFVLLKEANLSFLSLELVTQFLNRHPFLQKLELSHAEINDESLRDLAESGVFEGLQKLDLSGCTELTTDLFFTLALLPSLREIKLPELNCGKRSLASLPKFADPFKVAQYYLRSPLTIPHARSYYEGPSVWTAVFQIPMARSGVQTVFSPQDAIIDAKSLGYWLHEKDYERLEPQKEVTTIIGDYCSLVNDTNIGEFIRKFPNLSSLSLYGCPNITNQGVKNILDYLPSSKIKILDITACANIDRSAIRHPNVQLLDQFVMSIKGVFSDGNIINRYLSITDETLQNEDALDEVLNSKEVSELFEISFEGCSLLTNNILSRVLDQLSLVAIVEAGLNNRKLNIARLNIRGCVQITRDAFIIDEHHIRSLGNLDQILVDDSKLCEELRSAYPHLIVQTDNFLERGEVEVQKGSSYIHRKIEASLFPNGDQEVSFSKSWDIEDKSQRDLVLNFKKNRKIEHKLRVHREILYAHSEFFRKSLRPGGAFFKSEWPTFQHQSVSKKVLRKLTQLLYGQVALAGLDWRIAADLAKLTHPMCLNFSFHQRLLTHIHSQFSLEDADEMLQKTVELEDENGRKFYEEILIRKMNTNPESLEVISELAEIFNLSLLKDEVRKKIARG